MEYGSEFDLNANRPFLGENPVPESWQLFRSGRDALKAFARLAGKRRVFLPALCCESMLLPFAQNGYELGFYRLREDLSADEDDLRARLTDDAVLLYMRYFGVKPFSDAFLESLRREKPGLVFLEDRTHDILVRREKEGFTPDGTAASLRKWTALPEGGMLDTRLGVYKARTEPRYGDLRSEAMEIKSRFLESGDMALRETYTELFHRAEAVLDESGEPFAMRPPYRELLRGVVFDKILAARRRNLARLQVRLAPLITAGTIRPMTPAPERSGLYLPILVQNRDAVQRVLFGRKIYCPSAIWPEPKAVSGVCPVSRHITEHMIAVLCDQRYTEADMDYLADNLIEALTEDS